MSEWVKVDEDYSNLPIEAEYYWVLFNWDKTKTPHIAEAKEYDDDDGNIKCCFVHLESYVTREITHFKLIDASELPKTPKDES